MSTKLLSPRELRVWHAFQLMSEDVLVRVGRDISQATGLSGPEFGVLSRLAAIGNGEMGQQALARVMSWDKSRLSHQHCSRRAYRTRPREAGCCAPNTRGIGSAESVVATHP